MKKRILIFFIIFCVALTFLGTAFYIKGTAGTLALRYPTFLINSISHAPDGSSYNLFTLGEELAADLSTIFVVGGVRTIDILARDYNHQIRLKDCASTLDKGIYMVQAGLRIAQGTYPDPYYDEGRTLYDNFNIAINFLPDSLSDDETITLDIYNIPYNSMNVSYDSDHWETRYGYHITRDHEAFYFQVFDTTPDNLLTERSSAFKLGFGKLAKAGNTGNWENTDSYYTILNTPVSSNTYYTFTRLGNIPVITVAVGGDLLVLNNSYTYTYHPYGLNEWIYLAF